MTVALNITHYTLPITLYALRNRQYAIRNTEYAYVAENITNAHYIDLLFESLVVNILGPLDLNPQ